LPTGRATRDPCSKSANPVIPTTPATAANYRILEINNNPGLVPFHFPWKGESQDVAGAMIRMLLAHAA